VLHPVRIAVSCQIVKCWLSADEVDMLLSGSIGAYHQRDGGCSIASIHIRNLKTIARYK